MRFFFKPGRMIGGVCKQFCNKLFNSLGRGLLCHLSLRFYTWIHPPQVRPRTLLIIRLDALGDYILFRNFLSILRMNSPYTDYEITLLGNPKWKDIALRWDHAYVDRFIWLDPQRFRRNAIYQFRCLYQLQTIGFETLLASTHSRTRLMDRLARLLRAQTKIASQGDRFNLQRAPHHDTLSPYTMIIPSADEATFEFIRNRHFFERLFNMSIQLHKPELSIDTQTTPATLPKQFAVLVPGARHPRRRWSPNNFAQIARHLTMKYHYAVVLVGDKEDEAVGKQIKQTCPEAINLIGQTRTGQFVEILGSSDLVISNETSAIHIAAALDKPAICIANDRFFGRFHPYPPTIAPNITTLYPPAIQDRLEEYDLLVQEYGHRSQLDVNSITVPRVLCVIEQKMASLS